MSEWRWSLDEKTATSLCWSAVNVHCLSHGGRILGMHVVGRESRLMTEITVIALVTSLAADKELAHTLGGLSKGSEQMCLPIITLADD